MGGELVWEKAVGKGEKETSRLAMAGFRPPVSGHRVSGTSSRLPSPPLLLSQETQGGPQA